METKYNYFEEMQKDIVSYIADNEICLFGSDAIDYDELCDRLFMCDGVTGNASGSYTFSTWKAAECVCHNEDLLADALFEFYGESVPVEKVCNPEWCDVTIRCYLLSQVLNVVYGDFRDDLEEYYINHNMEE